MLMGSGREYVVRATPSFWSAERSSLWLSKGSSEKPPAYARKLPSVPCARARCWSFLMTVVEVNVDCSGKHWGDKASAWQGPERRFGLTLMMSQKTATLEGVEDAWVDDACSRAISRNERWR